MRHLSVGLFAALWVPQGGSAQDNAWDVGRTLALRISSSSPALTDSARASFRRLYTELQATHDSLPRIRRALTRRLVANRSALASHADSSATHDRARASWQDSLDAHNARCR